MALVISSAFCYNVFRYSLSTKNKIYQETESFFRYNYFDRKEKLYGLYYGNTKCYKLC